MTNNFNKKNLVRIISNDTGYSYLYSEKLINDLLKCIVKNISHENVNLKNFGNFKTYLKKERVGRNPKTKEEFLINQRKVIKFTPSKIFSAYINNF